MGPGRYGSPKSQYYGRKGTNIPLLPLEHALQTRPLHNQPKPSNPQVFPKATTSPFRYRKNG